MAALCRLEWVSKIWPVIWYPRQIFTATSGSIQRVILTVTRIVDYEDLAILAEQWLKTPGIPSADIAPRPAGDGEVNFLDFADTCRQLALQLKITLVSQPSNSLYAGFLQNTVVGGFFPYYHGIEIVRRSACDYKAIGT